MEIKMFQSLDDMDDFHHNRRQKMKPRERLEIYGQLNNVPDARENPFEETGIPIGFDKEDQVLYL